MNPIALLRVYAPSLAFRRAALRLLAREMEPEQAARVWEATQRRQREMRREGRRKARPRYGPGLSLVMRYFERYGALYSAATEEGIASETAGRWVEEIQWELFGPLIRLHFALSRLRSRHRQTRVRWIVDLMFALLFTAPFERTIVPSERDVAFDIVAFDVTVCPLAEYFREQGMPELTRHAACSLDYRMAEVWGVRLERARTIAEGHPLCDFRFRVEADQ